MVTTVRTSGWARSMSYDILEAIPEDKVKLCLAILGSVPKPLSDRAEVEKALALSHLRGLLRVYGAPVGDI